MRLVSVYGLMPYPALVLEQTDGTCDVSGIKALQLELLNFFHTLRNVKPLWRRQVFVYFF